MHAHTRPFHLLRLVAALIAPAAMAGNDAAVWATRPPVKAAPPAVRDPAWAEHPVDRFVQAARESRGLPVAPEADKRALLRRLTHDLTGLPPTVEELDQFLRDESPAAYSNVVERLLASPAYGERQGRHWLDVARYADTAGCNSDFPVADAWRYRNWVIDAFNADMPYDDFLRRQIAGDLLPAATPEDRDRNLIATGYLGMSRRFASQTNEFYLTVDDTVENLGRAVMGLSTGCARCHDHKYDPLAQRDYAALYGIFQSCVYTFPGVEVVPMSRDHLALGGEDQQRLWNEYEEKVFRTDLEFRDLKDKKRHAMERLPEGMTRETRMEALKKETKELLARPPQVDVAYGVREGRVGDSPVLEKGKPGKGAPVPRGFPPAYGGSSLGTNVTASGRVELVDWLTRPDHPLTARVMVNRIWQSHFGKGLVQTPNDFGARGKAPTHPELLDWLAVTFRESGWRVKSLHRLLVTSRAYRMSTVEPAGGSGLDPANDFLWHFDRRRLSAEEIRDTLLTLAGTLDRTPGGPHPFPPRKEWSYTQHNPFLGQYDTDRRAVYLMQPRLRKESFLDIWDGADSNVSTGARALNVTPIQSLHLMNNARTHERAGRFAQRMRQRFPDDPARIRQAFTEAYARPATEPEITAALEFLRASEAELRAAGSADPSASAWAGLARVIVASNEFLHVE